MVNKYLAEKRHGKNIYKSNKLCNNQNKDKIYKKSLWIKMLLGCKRYWMIKKKWRKMKSKYTMSKNKSKL